MDTGKAKNRKFLIATHGTFAAGAKSALDIIIGEMENVFLIQGYVSENKSIDGELKSILEQVGQDDEIIIFTDLLGGSITNQVLQFASKPNVHLVSGFNLPLLIDVLLADTNTPVAEIMEIALSNAKEQMVYVNKLMESKMGKKADD